MNLVFILVALVFSACGNNVTPPSLNSLPPVPSIDPTQLTLDNSIVASGIIGFYNVSNDVYLIIAGDGSISTSDGQAKITAIDSNTVTIVSDSPVISSGQFYFVVSTTRIILYSDASLVSSVLIGTR